MIFPLSGEREVAGPDVDANAQSGSAADLTLDAEWMASACLGGMLPQDVADDLQRAALLYQRGNDAEPVLLDLYQRAWHHPAVHIALYRFYFYRHRLQDALDVAVRCLLKVAGDLGLPEDWRAVQPEQAKFAGPEYEIVPRFYLYTLKGCAYLNMRLGRLQTGGEMLAQLRRLDPRDRLGGSVLADVLAHIGESDDD